MNFLHIIIMHMWGKLEFKVQQTGSPSVHRVSIENNPKRIYLSYILADKHTMCIVMAKQIEGGLEFYVKIWLISN